MVSSVRSSIVVVLWVYFIMLFSTARSSSTTGSSSSSSTKKSGGGVVQVKRVKHLDYLDAATMRYYMSSETTTLTYDVAVLFYAQWCKNCHALAPVWDQISRILQAGTTESKVIVALFDCEANYEHAEICNAARVTHYPTIAFFSMAGNHHHFSRRTPKHMIHYSANWQIGEAILDWIRTMSGLAQWHRAGWEQRLRNALFFFGRNEKAAAPEPLPIGLPKSIADEKELIQLRKQKNESYALSVRSSTFVSAVLFPILQEVGIGYKKNTTTTNSKDATTIISDDDGKNYTDVYAMLHQQNGWSDDKKDMNAVIMDQIIRTCVSEVSLDYCSRLTTTYMDAWIESWPIHQPITDAVYGNLTQQIHNDLMEHEPFCAVMDNCTLSNFAESYCQPKACPFTDRTVCRYITACLTPQLQLEYAEALDLFSTTTPSSKTHNEPVGNNPKEKKQESKKKRDGFSWGL